ncbi:MAG: ATP-dependent DNA helicase [Lautropia sp.]
MPSAEPRDVAGGVDAVDAVGTVDAVAAAGAVGASVSVRALCDFTARCGDLDLALRPTASAAEGLAIHQRAAQAADAGLRHEVPVAVEIDGLRVRGRIDALDEARGRVEEIKSHRGARERIPAMRTALHWAQAETYAAMHALAAPSMPARVEVSLRFVEVDSGEETLETRRCDTAALVASLKTRAACFARWIAQERAHRCARDAFVAALAFPPGAFRPGQRVFAAAVYRSGKRARALLAEAPTGLGKSIAAVFGALKAMHAASLDKVLLLTCRTTGAHGLLRALAQCRGRPDAPLRVLELGSRERACQRRGAACTPQGCDLAVGFYDRLPAARSAALAQGVASIESLAGFSSSHGLCPYHLAHELVAWADVIVADVNHWFDRHAGLQTLARADGWKVGVVVDEAHNLVERTRSMYTRALAGRDVEALAALLPQVGALGALARSWRRTEARFAAPYQQATLPEAFTRKLGDAADALAAVLADLPTQCPHATPAQIDSAWDLLALRSLLEEAGDGDVLEALRDPPDGVGGTAGSGVGPAARRRGCTSTLRVRCVVPSAHLVGAWSAAPGTTLMSATLSPFDFHRRLLGVPDTAAEFACASPWQGQLRVVVRTDISTRWRDRSASAARIGALVREVLRASPGNYLVFASSYAYLELLHDAVVQPDAGPAFDTWMQSPRMTDADKAAFLDRFVPGGVGVGFAVLGGGFGEGIDLVGSRLGGAFVATLGLPQADAANEASRRLIEQRFGDGWTLNDLVPGLTKVGQAGGRIVRSVDDRGTLYLLDDRYAQRAVRAALPSWWFAPAGGHARRPDRA